MAFGGAGPLHACALAEELGNETRARAGGSRRAVRARLVASDERRDVVTAYVCPLEEAGALPAEGEADLRYRGQSFELTVPLGPDLGERFHRAHEERYGSADRAREIELVAVRTADVRPGPDLRAGRRVAAGGGAPDPRARRRHLLDSPRVGGG